MTGPAQDDGEASPSIAALAVRVEALRRDFDALTAQAGELASTQRQHSVLLEGVGELRRQIDQVLGVLTGQDDETPATWFWLTMAQPEREEKLGELADWVETVLRVQYPAYLEGQIRRCWPNHPEARWELAWLYQLWSLAYLAEQREPRRAGDWHDRWYPGVIRRLGVVMHGCNEGCELASQCEPMSTP